MTLPIGAAKVFPEESPTKPPIAADFMLSDFGEPQRERGRSALFWEEIVALFEEQRLSYMRDFYSPKERLANKVPEPFVM